MCMRPCGPVRHHYYARVRKATVKNYDFEFWTDSFRCGGRQVGGNFKCLLGNTEVAKLQKVAKNFGRDLEAIKEHAPEIFVKLENAAYKALEYQMAAEVYGDYDFSDSKFKGWRRDRKIRYIIADASEPTSALFSIGFEIPEGF